jgi:hypothetical protein
MPEASIHARLIHYLVAVLEQLFAGEIYALHENLNFYQTPALYEHPLAPDIALVKGVCWEEIRSWKIDRTGPPPQLVIEIASEETWKNDRKKKSALYGPMGVLEYFVYDPNTPPCWKDTPRRLFGWRWDPTRHKMRKIRSNKQGWLWSQQLNSWLVPDDGYLRLYDRHHQLHLTGEEAQALRADAEAEARRVEAKRAEEEKRRADAEAEARQTEAKRAQALAEKLRALGINPDEIA